MAIQAIALLSIADLQLPAEPPVDKRLRVQRIDDAVLLHTGLGFSAEPEELARGVRGILGEALDAHADPRGIFFIPDVAAPKARNYAAVVAEVGEGGMWGSLPDESSAASLGMPAGFEAALGSMLGQLPSGLLDSLTQAATRGDMGALQQASMGLQTLMQTNPQLAGLAADLEKSALQAGLMTPSLEAAAIEDIHPFGEAGSVAPSQAAQPDGDAPGVEDMLAKLGIAAESPALAAMLGGAGVDIDSPAFAQLMSQVQAQLASDPGLLMSMAEQLMGGAPGQAPGLAEADDADEADQGVGGGKKSL